MPALLRTSRSKAIPSMACPENAFESRRKARGSRSMMATRCPSDDSMLANCPPTRPHPMITTRISPHLQLIASIDLSASHRPFPDLVGRQNDGAERRHQEPFLPSHPCGAEQGLQRWQVDQGQGDQQLKDNAVDDPAVAEESNGEDRHVLGPRREDRPDLGGHDAQ